MVKSRILQKLRSGEHAVVAPVSRVKDPWLTEVIGTFGYDGVWFDMEHRHYGYDVLDPISLACRATGMDFVVRILKEGYTAPMRALEAGASVLIVPHCKTPEEARQWASWTFYPPKGTRGFDGAGADTTFMLDDARTHLTERNNETLLILQIEDREAVECVDEIAALDGVDLLFIGPGDLSISLGVPFEMNSPVMQRAIDRIANAAAKHGKWWGMPTGSPEAAQALLDRGGRFMTCGSDHVFLVNGYRNAIEPFKKLQIKTPAETTA